MSIIWNWEKNAMKTIDLRIIKDPAMRKAVARLRCCYTAGVVKFADDGLYHNARSSVIRWFDDRSQQAALKKSATIESDRIPSLMPPIGVGHEDDDNVLGRSDLPKQGEVINLYLDGNVLMADFGRVPLSICKLVKGGIYDKVSCELWESPPGKFAGTGWMLKRVALLGADVPGVYTLSEIPDPDEGMGIIRGVEIFEVGCHNDIEYTLDDLKNILRNYWLNRPSEEKAKQLVRRYLKLDAVKPLGDGAATDQFKDASQTVRVFRSMSKTFTVDTSTGRKNMTAEQIRQALVAEGIFEQDEVNSMSDAIVMKLAKMVGMESANADAEPAKTTDPEKKSDAACASDDDTTPVETPPDRKPDAAMADDKKVAAFADKMIAYKVAKALAPLQEKLDQMTETLKSTKTYVDVSRREDIKEKAIAFCDKMRTEKKLTFGMHKNAVELFEYLAVQPQEVHFSDGAKKKKGSPLELFKQMMSNAPVLEDWDEHLGGPIGAASTDDRKKASHDRLKAKYQSFNSSFKKTMSEQKYLAAFDAAVEMYGDDYSVDQFISS
jgi:hypothetical protein